MTSDPFAAAVVPRTAARPAEAGADRPASATSDHERLTAGTADLWRQLVHLCWKMPT